MTGVLHIVDFLPSFDVFDGGSDDFRAVPKLSDSVIALVTEKPANTSSNMIMVNVENSAGIVSDSARRPAADGTLAVLFGENLFILRQCDAVVSPKLTGADFKISIFNKFVVNQLFQIWFKRIFGAARLVFSSITDKYVSRHSSEVVLVAAHRTGTILPYAARTSVFARWSAFYNDTLFGIVSKPSPVVMAEGSTDLAAVRSPDQVRLRLLKIVLQVFNFLTKRADMLLGGDRGNFWAGEPVFLEKPLTNHQFAKITLDSRGTFHKSILSVFCGNASNFCKVKYQTVSF